MTRKILITCMILMLVTPGAYADEETNALDYIPPANFVAGWDKTGDEFLADPAQAGFLIGDYIPLLMEYECVWYATETYMHGEDEMDIEIFEFPSSSDAYGYYNVSYIDLDRNTDISVYSDLMYIDEVRPYDLPPASEMNSLRRITEEGVDLLEGYQDRFYFRIRVVEEYLPVAGIQAGMWLMSNLPGQAIPANMLSLLPDEDRVIGTERYIRGPIGLSTIINTQGDDILGFNQLDWEAITAEYRLGGGEYYLLIKAEYEDADSADAAAGMLQDLFQDQDWQTMMVAPLENGAHPRAFYSDIFTAYWPEDEFVIMLWDLTDQDALLNALSNF